MRLFFRVTPAAHFGLAGSERLSMEATARANFLHVLTARPVQKMHLVKIREREKYDTPPVAQQWNNLLKKEKPGEAGL